MPSKITLPPAVLRTLSKYDQWVLYEAKTKIPQQVHRRSRAATDRPSTWSKYNDAYKRRNGHNLGFVLSEEDPFCCIDLDNCVTSGLLHKDAKAIVKALDSYAEYSPSGNGVHIWIRAHLVGNRHKNAKCSWGGSFEVYDRLRYMTLTGNRVPGAPAVIRQRQEQLEKIVAKVLGVSTTKKKHSKPGEVEIGERYPELRSLMGALFHRNVAPDEIIEKAYEYNQEFQEPLDEARLERVPHFMGWLEEHAETEEDEFWSSTPILGHIRSHAQANLAAPLAALGCTLARVCAATPHLVHLPGRGAGDNHGSLNTFVALVGEPGAGKDQALAESEASIDVGDDEIAKLRLGSGEGLAHAFKRKKQGDEYWVRQSVLFQESEIETVVTLGTRQGSTLHSELRSAWSSGALGHAFADPAKALNVPAHSYRVALVAGVQPTKAGPILADVGGGFPQRFIWLVCADPYAPDEMLDSPLQRVAQLAFEDVDKEVVMPVCHQARMEVIENARARLRSKNVDPMQGHWLLAKLRVAANLAILHGCTNIDEEWWQLADWIMRKSDEGRALCSYSSWKDSQQEQKRKERSARGIGQASALGAADADESKFDVERDKCEKIVTTMLMRAGPRARVRLGDISRRMPNERYRKEHMTTVLSALVESGRVDYHRINTSGVGRPGSAYSWVKVGS